MLIYIVRHGETQANAKGYLQGWSEDPLNENGIKLAVLTGQNMRNIRFDYCISSPLIRAKETAEIILKESNNAIKVETDNRLKEINFGDYELRKTKSLGLEKFFSDPFNCPQFPNGENVQMLIKRTQSFLNELIAINDDKCYLVVTHGCALRAMLNMFYDNKTDFWHGNVPFNCCVNIIEVKNGEGKIKEEDKVFYPQEMVFDWYK